MPTSNSRSTPRDGSTAPADNTDKEYGEGNYKAAREYDNATEKFVREGKVGEAAHAARPRTQKEAEELIAAEEEGRAHSKGEDPLLNKKTPR